MTCAPSIAPNEQYMQMLRSRIACGEGRGPRNLADTMRLCVHASATEEVDWVSLKRTHPGTLREMYALVEKVRKIRANAKRKATVLSRLAGWLEFHRLLILSRM